MVSKLGCESGKVCRFVCLGRIVGFPQHTTPLKYTMLLTEDLRTAYEIGQGSSESRFGSRRGRCALLGLNFGRISLSSLHSSAASTYAVSRWGLIKFRARQGLRRWLLDAG